MSLLDNADWAEQVPEPWSNANEARDEFIARMKSMGRRVDIPTENELFIDIDSDAQYKVFKRNLEAFINNFDKNYRISSTSEWFSKSGSPRRHIKITFRYHKLSDTERILIQAILGSDSMRELLSYARLQKGDINPTLFVEESNE